MVGSSILRNFKKKNYRKIFVRSRKQLNLLNQEKTEKFFKKIKPDFVIIAAAKVGGILSNDTFKGEYIYQYPGLIHNAHPDGYSVPCCFKRPRKDEAPKKIEKSYNYIVDSIKYPVPEERLGFLPLPAQLFFNKKTNPWHRKKLLLP